MEGGDDTFDLEKNDPRYLQTLLKAESQRMKELTIRLKNEKEMVEKKERRIAELYEMLQRRDQDLRYELSTVDKVQKKQKSGFAGIRERVGVVKDTRRKAKLDQEEPVGDERSVLHAKIALEDQGGENMASVDNKKELSSLLNSLFNINEQLRSTHRSEEQAAAERALASGIDEVMVSYGGQSAVFPITAYTTFEDLGISASKYWSLNPLMTAITDDEGSVWAAEGQVLYEISNVNEDKSDIRIMVKGDETAVDECPYCFGPVSAHDVKCKTCGQLLKKVEENKDEKVQEKKEEVIVDSLDREILSEERRALERKYRTDRHNLTEDEKYLLATLWKPGIIYQRRRRLLSYRQLVVHLIFVLFVSISSLLKRDVSSAFRVAETMTSQLVDAEVGSTPGLDLGCEPGVVLAGNTGGGQALQPGLCIYPDYTVDVSQANTDYVPEPPMWVQQSFVTFEDVGTIDEFWVWATRTLLPFLFPLELYDSEYELYQGNLNSPSVTGNEFYVSMFNRLVGGLRLKQLRVKNGGMCTISEMYKSDTNGDCFNYYDSNLSANKATYGWATDTTKCPDGAATTNSRLYCMGYGFRSSSQLGELFTLRPESKQVVHALGEGYAIDIPFALNTVITDGTPTVQPQYRLAVDHLFQAIRSGVDTSTGTLTTYSTYYSTGPEGDNTNSNRGGKSDYQWIDIYTRRVYVQFMLYTPASDLFTFCNLFVDIHPSGRVDTSSNFRTLRFNVWYSQTVTFTFVLRLIFIVVVFLFWLWYVVTFVLHILESMALNVRRKRFRKLLEWLDVWAIIEIVVLFSMFISQLLFLIYSVHPDVLNFDITSTSFKDWTMLDNVWRVSFDFEGIALFLALMRTFKYFRYTIKMYVIWITLYFAKTDIISFSVIATFLYLAFIFWGMVTFGGEMERMSTPFQTGVSLTLMTLGEFESIGGYDALVRSNSLVAPIFLVTFILLFVFILVNVLLAILSESYNKAKDAEREDLERTELVDQMLSVKENEFKAFMKFLFVQPIAAVKSQAQSLGSFWQDADTKLEQDFERIQKKKEALQKKKALEEQEELAAQEAKDG